MQIEYNIFNKTSTRLPESLSVVFTPMPQYGFSWMLSKLGQQIDPKSVVLNSSQYQHGEIVLVNWLHQSLNQYNLARRTKLKFQLITPS